MMSFLVPYRSAVKDTDEWPSKYSKFFVEVRNLHPLDCPLFEFHHDLIALV